MDMPPFPGGDPTARQRFTPPDQDDPMAAQLQRLRTELAEARAARVDLLGLPQDAMQQQGPYGPYGPQQGPYGPGGYGPPGAPPPGVIAPPPGVTGLPPEAGPYGPYGPYGPGQAGGRGQWQPGQPPQANGQPQGEEASQEIKVWAHDLTVEPGKTYRYRVIVSVLNPLFRQSRVPESQQQEFFNQVALGPAEQELEASPWTEPVRVDPERYFFFIQGAPQNQIAQVEVWRVFNGRWRRDEFQVQPGDPIGGTMEVTVNGQERTIDMHADAVAVDLAAVGGNSPFGGDTLLLYLDRLSGRIASRSAAQDSGSTERIRLENEAFYQAEMQEMAMSSP